MRICGGYLRFRSVQGGCIAGICFLLSSTAAQPPAAAFSIRPEFANELNDSQANPPSDQSSCAYVQGGSVGAYSPPDSGLPAVTPSDGNGVTLVESSFGQMLSSDVPQPGFVDESIRLAQTELYPIPGENRAQIEAGTAVFRYKELLYGRDADGGVSVDFNAINKWYGDNERQKFESAIQPLRDALKYAPLDRKLHEAILDAYYDRFVAEMQFIKRDLTTISEYRLGFRLPGASEFIIDHEIEIYESFIAEYKGAMQVYSQLLSDRLGVDVNALSVPAASGIPLGSYLFQNEQPARNQMAAQFVDSDGILKTVPTYDPASGQTQTAEQSRVLFTGYKDFVTLLGLLRDYSTDAAELARLYGMRGRKTPERNDILEAYKLIRDTQSEVALSGALLRGMFPDFDPPPGDASGVQAALKGIENGLADLTQVRSFLDGQSNSLGFSPDFLVLIQEFPDSTQGNQFDSYDAMVRWIRNTSSSPLNYAESTFNQAFASYDKYKGFADQVFNELDNIENTYSDRYVEITGYDPSDNTANHITSPKPGSELWEANHDIELANTRVRSMRDRTENIQEGVAIANNAVKDADGKTEGIENALTDYKNDTKSAWTEITTWAGITAGVQAAYDTTADIAGLDFESTVTTGGSTIAAIAVAGVINTAAQTVGAVRTKIREKELEYASATYDADLAKLDAESAKLAASKDLNDAKREQIGISLENADDLSIQAQGIARRSGLLRELERIQQQMDASESSLHDRYYADPIHFLRAQNNMILADQAFREAQRWVFFTLRALEFKWNKDFAISWLGKDWDAGSIFKLRNFTELEQLVGAMEEFNRINLIGFNREPFVDVISLKNDVLASFAGTGVDDGLRFDTVAREMVSATELFRRKLARNQDAGGNIVINLNTFALEKEAGFFFLGPRYNSNGSVLSAGKYLDKIEWVKFKLVGNFPEAVRDGDLTYGGTCYVRNRVPPCIDLNNSTSLSGEYRVFPFFYFYTLDNGATWQTRRTQEDTVKLVFSPNSGEPDAGVIGSTLENRFLKERSVAATDWVLTIPAGAVDISQLNDLEIYVRHLFVSRVTPVCN
jgi:hypothetical protein